MYVVRLARDRATRAASDRRPRKTSTLVFTQEFTRSTAPGLLFDGAPSQKLAKTMGFKDYGNAAFTQGAHGITVAAVR